MLQQTIRKMSLLQFQQRHFTRSVKKIILTEDIEKLGFKGEICFVKPGRAFNHLVPRQQALFFSDPRVPAYQKEIDHGALKLKQEERNLEIFLKKLQQINIVFERSVSEINKNVTQQPLLSSEVLDQLNKRYNMGLKEENFKMEA